MVSSIRSFVLVVVSESTALGGDEGETAHAPCVRRGCVNGYSHLLNGSSEACLQSPEVGDASVMLKEGVGSTCNHFGSSWVTSTLPPRVARRLTVTTSQRFSGLHTSKTRL